MTTADFTIKAISAAEARPHRLTILRPGQEIQTVTYANDESEDSGHFAIVCGGEVAAVGSVLRDSLPSDDKPRAWRLRGMATYPNFQRQGFASVLVQTCIEHAAKQGAEVIWCNARSHVTELYEKFGFSKHGEEFEIPEAGLHYMMVKSLT